MRSETAKKITEVKDLLAHSKRLETDVGIVRNVSSKLVESVVVTERQCWQNAQYSRRDTLDVVGIPASITGNVLGRKVFDVFQEIGVNIYDCYIQACHRLKDKDQTSVKFTNRKDCLQILKLKRQLKGLEHAAVDLPDGTKIVVNESLSIWNKMQNFKGQTKSALILYNKWYDLVTN